MAPVIRAAYDPPEKLVGVVKSDGRELELVLDCASEGEEGVSRTRQSMKAETEINNIIAKYRMSGMVAHVNARSPVYADVADVSSYEEALEQVRVADEFFGGLPARVRQRFNNNPAEFLDFMSDERNQAEAEELGLVKREPVEPAPVEGSSSSPVVP